MANQWQVPQGFSLVGAEAEKYEWFLVFDDGGFPIIAARAFITKNIDMADVRRRRWNIRVFFFVESPELKVFNNNKQREIPKNPKILPTHLFVARTPSA